MINKYQAGGAAPQGSILQEIAKLPQEQQKKIMTAFGKWAQAKGLNIQQLQGNEQALEQAMGQFLQEVQSQQAPKARLGAKLNYIRTLKGNAPEGMVVEYYKCGGQTKKRFVKAAGGAKAKDGKKEIAEFKKKKACGGTKVFKKQAGSVILEDGQKQGGVNTWEADPNPGYIKTAKAQSGSKMMQLAEANKNRKKAEEEKKKREDKWKKGQIVVGRDIQRGNGGPNTTKQQDSAVPNEDVPSYDKKTKKHFFGGILGF